MLPEVWNAEMMMRLIASVAIIFLYADNTFTGWEVCRDRRAHLPPWPARLYGLWLAACFLILRYRFIKSQPLSKRLEAREALHFYAPYISTPLSVIGALAHISWFAQGAWQTQVGLFVFAVLHNGMSFYVHATHLAAYLISPKDDPQCSPNQTS